MTRRRAFNVRSACKPLAMTCLALVFAMLSSGVFAGNANIPQLYITIPAADFDAVCDAEAVWGPIWTKEYVEKGCTIRMRYPGDSSDRFNVNCGLRNHGGGAAHGQAKRSFRLKFRGPEYGVKRLNYPILERAPLHANSKQGFDNLVLRGGGNENSSANSELTLTYMRDEWVRATQIDMSGFGNHGTFVNLYVNGQYWGLYNMTERADRAWGQMWFGGTKGDWASWRDGDPRSDPPRPPEGDQTRYNTAKSKCKNAANLSLSELRNYINPEAFADYMILGFFTGASDWKCANTWAVTRNSPAGLTYWTWWDAEFAFEGGDNYSHRIKTDEAEWWVDGSYAAKLYGEKHDFLQFFYDGLIKNAEFKQVFSDRARLHLTGTGALTDAKCKARWDALKNFIAGDVAADRTRWSAPKAWNPDHIRNRMTGNADAAFNAFDAKGWILYGGLPDAPSAVTANAVSETRVNLTWQDNSDDEDGFKIDRRISGGSEWVRIATPSANVEAASDTGVTAGTTYSYKIKAYNAAGSGAYSATASVTTPGSAPSPPSIPGLVARWAFDEGSGTVADDSSGHGYNGTLVGGPKWTSGKYGTALDFDGVDDYVHVPGHALHFPTGNSPRTVCGWFEADAAHTEYKRQFFGYGSWEYGYGKAFTCLAATKYIAIAFNGTRTEKTGVSVGAGWHHVAFVVPDGATKTDQVRFYLDGNLLTGYTATGNGAQTLNTYVDPNQANAEIAWFNEGKRDGKLDDIRIYNRALSAAEIQTVMNDGGGSPPPEPPAQPSGVTATALSSTQIRVTWQDNSSNETQFKIRRSPDGEDWDTLTPVFLAANTTTYTDSGLTAGTVRYYKVRAENAAGNSAYTDPVNATTSGGSTPQPPAAPGNFAGTALSDTQVRLSWTDTSDNEAEFKIRWSTDGSDFETLTPIFLPADTTRYTQSGLAPNTTYYYMLRSQNDAGTQGYLTPISVTTQAGGAQVPAPPNGVTAVAVAADRIDVRWTDNSDDEAGFKIDRRQSGTSTWIRIAEPGPNVTTLQDTGLPAETKFYYIIKAYNAAGNSAYSATADAATPAATPSVPAQPSGVAATALSATEIRITWQDASDNETQFKIRRSLDGVDWYALDPVFLAANTTSYTDSGLTPGTTRYYIMRAENAAGVSAYTDPPVSAATPADAAIPNGAVWRYRKGTAEASEPAGAWRRPGFDDSAWPAGPAPLGYGQAGLATTLTDMQNSYSCLFLRAAFNVAHASRVTDMRLNARFDDGFILWINGQEIARVNVPGQPGDPVAFDTFALSNLNSSVELAWTGAQLPELRDGANVAAVQVFNRARESGDLFFDVELTLSEGALPQAEDADGDGLPDAWEAAHLAGLSDPADRSASADPDGDGLSNLEEFIAGTDPAAGGSVFAVDLAWAPGHGLIVSFAAAAAAGTGYEDHQRHYALEQRDAVGADATWLPVPGYEDVLGAGQTAAYTNATPADGACYRARVWLTLTSTP